MNVHVTLHPECAVIEEISEAPTRVRMAVSSSRVIKARMGKDREADFVAEISKAGDLELGERLPVKQAG